MQPFEDKIVVSNNVQELRRSITDMVPSDFELQIDSFSTLCYIAKEHKLKRYESNCFEAGGYKWKLALYPNGDLTPDSNGYISIYLVLADAESWSVSCEVNVEFRMFVYDKVHDNYLVVEDAKESISCFHQWQTEYGISCLISFEKFKNPRYGYLVDDSCVFGADVRVLTRTRVTQCLQLIREPDNQIHTWKIHDVSKHVKSGVPITAHPIKAFGRTWVLEAFEHPADGSLDVSIRWVNFFSYLPCWMRAFEKFSISSYLRHWQKDIEEKFYIDFLIRVINQKDGLHKEIRCNSWFSYSNGDAKSIDGLISAEELFNESSSFIVNDTLIIEAQFIFAVEGKDNSV